MFGAYQAGAWKALSRQIAPDIVVGASVGALNGWYVAGGAAPEELEQHWLDPITAELMTPRIPPLPLFDPRPLEERAKFVTSNYAPRVEYGLVMLKLPKLERTLVRNDEVTWRHLVASCSLPIVFPPVRIGKNLYCDGGLLEATPIWAAAKMGASRVIAVNASAFIPPRAIWPLVEGVQRLGRKTRPLAPGISELVLISPKTNLGKLSDGGRWREENIRRWIEMGERDAIAAIDRHAIGLPSLR